MNDLRINGSLSPPLLSRDSGPGLRWLLFLQGCARPCTKDCLNPHFLDPSGGRIVTQSELRVTSGQVASGLYGPVEGLTILGGEPTDQARNLLPVLQEAQSIGLSVMLYSGHPLSWFHRPENIASLDLLESVDILVDGPFIAALTEPSLRWRGSTNQKIRLISNRYDEKVIIQDLRRAGVTLTVRGRGFPVISGLQNRRLATEVEEEMAAYPKHQE